MSEETHTSSGAPAARGRQALLLVLWTAAAIGSAFTPALTCGLLFVPLAVLALAVLPFPDRVGAVVGARDTWESVARLSWTAGAIAAIVLFVRALGLPEGGIEAIATGMALAFIPAVVGLALAGLSVAVAFRFSSPPDPPTPGSGAVWLARALFLVLVTCAALLPRLGHGELPHEPWDWLLHGPALLTLAGATLLLLLLFGRAWKRLSPVALAVGGTLAALVGLVQALLGMAHGSIAQVTAGTQSITTACFAALVALSLLSVSPERTESRDGIRTANHVAYALFPLVTLLLLAVELVMVMTPMKAPL